MKKQPLPVRGWLKKSAFDILTFLIILGAIVFRFSFYEDIRLSIATNDSSSYYNQVELPLFSWEAFTSRRFASYPVFLSLFKPEDGFPSPTAISYPAAHGVGTRKKAMQPGFDIAVSVQAILAVFSWTFFTVIFCRRLNNKLLRPIAAAIILAFAFTPSMVEWDSILMTESLCFSSFILLSAITVELLFRIFVDKKIKGKITGSLFVIWGLLVPVWAFLRDSNANTLIILVVLLFLLLAIPNIRKQIPVYWVTGLAVWVGFLAFWYSFTTLSANRWIYGWTDIYYDWIKGYSSRLKFFTDHGMPRPWTPEWVKENGSKTYLLFLFQHPGFMITEFFGRLSDAFSENIQPFFYTYPTLWRKMVLALGDILHPLSSTAFVFPLVSGFLIVFSGLRENLPDNLPWMFFIIWIICIIYGLYVASFFGDSAGLIRHSMGGVVFMRLLVWMTPIILTEVALKNRT